MTLVWTLNGIGAVLITWGLAGGPMLVLGAAGMICGGVSLVVSTVKLWR